MFLSFLFAFFYCLIFYFTNKLLVLLSFEGLMLTVIWIYFIFYGLSDFSFVLGLFFVAFLVLDSVIGLCLLINSVRSGFSSVFFFTV